MPGTFIRLVRGKTGEILDATGTVTRYLESLPDKTADPQLHRIRLPRLLRTPLHGFPEMQPLRGAKPN